jgi:hypothetical protein
MLHTTRSLAALALGWRLEESDVTAMPSVTYRLLNG